MLYSPYLLRSPDQAELDPVADLSQKPTTWAIPELLPCHRLTLIAGPSGVGLSSLAYRLLAAVAPAPEFVDAPRALPFTASVPSPLGEGQGGGRLPIEEPLDTTGFAPEDLLPDPNDPDWDPLLPLVPPDKRKPQPVDPVCPTALLITFRDDHDVLRPRLLAAGVDPNRVLVLTEMSVPDPEDPNKRDPQHYLRPFALEDACFLDRLLHEHKSIRLVLIDNADLLTNAQKRPTRHSLQQQLLRLHYVAHQRAVAIALLAPIPKPSARPFQTAFLLALQEACREVYLLAPALPGEAADTRYLFSLKHTYPSPAPNLQLCPVVRHPVPQPLSAPALPMGFTPTDLTYATYLQLRRRRPGPLPLARQQAIQFLTTLLAAGPLPVGDKDNPPPNSLRAQVLSAGLSWGTIRRAATDMNLRIFRDAECWYWQLPAAPALATSDQGLVTNDQHPTCAPFSHSSLITHHSSAPTNDQGPMTNDNQLTCAPSSSSSFILPPSSLASAPIQSHPVETHGAAA